MTPTKSETTIPPILRTQALTKRFQSIVAVDSLDLTVAPGTIFGLLGPNGAGKSTTIRMLTTLLPPTSGTAEVAGHDIIRDPSGVRRHIGYVPQLLSADGSLTGYENLLLSARLYDVPKREQRPRITEALTFMGLESAAKTLVKTYSGGMVRRLELAQATLHHPALLFLDEPTIGLDPIARRAVWERLRESREKFAMTMLLTTHDMEEADALCDMLAIMHAGRIAALGTPQALKAELGPNATLDDVFVKAAGVTIDQGGTFRDTVNTRRTATRLG
jgi:ABC-2 type transport system ATP-binding protein